MKRRSSFLLFLPFEETDLQKNKIIAGPFLDVELSATIASFSDKYECEESAVSILEEKLFQRRFPKTYRNLLKQRPNSFLESFVITIPGMKEFHHDFDNSMLYSEVFIINYMKKNEVQVNFGIHVDSGYTAFIMNELNSYLKSIKVDITIGNVFYLSPLEKTLFFAESAYSRFLSENFLTHKERLN